MPFGDGTGPRGQGPMTGRGLGSCAGFNQSRSAQAAPKRGCGRGRRFGRGRAKQAQILAREPARNLSKDEKIQILKGDKQAIDKEMQVLEKKLENIKKKLEEIKEQ